jgi:chemotaxis protein MotB
MRSVEARRWAREQTSVAMLVLGLCSLMVAQGCVKKSDYDAMRAENRAQEQKLESDLDAEKKKVSSLEQALAEEQGKNKQQADEIARLTEQLDAAHKKEIELQNQLTDMVHNSSSLKASIQEMQSALAALQDQRKQTEARIAEYKKLLESFKKLIDAGKLKVKVVAGRMVVELPSDILFASGSIDLSKDGTTALSEVGKIFAGMRERKFQVEGHTDDQPIRTTRFPSNWELAAGRAIAVATILIKSGVAPTNVSAASFGEFRPVASNAKPETRAQNRRIEIVLVPDLSKVPGFEELERASKG